MTITFNRPILQYSLHDADAGIVIYHPAGEVRVTDCPKCLGPLAGLSRRERPDARRGTIEMLICPSCRSDISGRVIEILVDLTRSLSHRDEKGDYARVLDRVGDRVDGDRGPGAGADGHRDRTPTAPSYEDYDDNPVAGARVMTWPGRGHTGRRIGRMAPEDGPIG